MASELRVNTLKDAAGSNEVAMTYVANGTAKAWMQFDGSLNTVNESFATSSLTDNALGRWNANLSNAFTNDNFAHNVSSIASSYNTSIDAGYVGASIASLRVRNDATTYNDADGCVLVCQGDLA